MCILVGVEYILVLLVLHHANGGLCLIFLPLAHMKDSDDSLWPVPVEDEDASQTPPTTMPPQKYTETPPPLKVSDITPPQNDPVGAITEGEE